MKFLVVFLIAPLMCTSSLITRLLAEPTAAPPTVATFTVTPDWEPTATPQIDMTLTAYSLEWEATVASYTPTPSHTPTVIPTNTPTADAEAHYQSLSQTRTAEAPTPTNTWTPEPPTATMTPSN